MQADSGGLEQMGAYKGWKLATDKGGWKRLQSHPGKRELALVNAEKARESEE